MSQIREERRFLLQVLVFSFIFRNLKSTTAWSSEWLTDRHWQNEPVWPTNHVYCLTVMTLLWFTTDYLWCCSSWWSRFFCSMFELILAGQLACYTVKTNLNSFPFVFFLSGTHTPRFLSIFKILLFTVHLRLGNITQSLLQDWNVHCVGAGHGLS